MFQSAALTSKHRDETWRILDQLRKKHSTADELAAAIERENNSLGSLLESVPKEELVKELLDPKNDSLEARVVAARLWLDRTDFPPVESLKRPTLVTPPHQEAPALPSLSMPGELPTTVKEYVAFAEGKHSPQEIVATLQLLQQTEFGATVARNLQLAGTTVPQGLEEQKKWSLEVEEMTQFAREQLASGHSFEYTLAKIVASGTPVAMALSKALSSPEDVDLTWASAKLGNAVIGNLGGRQSL